MDVEAVIRGLERKIRKLERRLRRIARDHDTLQKVVNCSIAHF
jgi:hypothetical protein